MAIIYHITTLNDWNQAKAKGIYESPSLIKEGFIHCSEEAQIEGVLHRYFEITKDLVKLEIDTNKLIPELKYELSPALNELFPHVCGPINLNAVTGFSKI
jgi:uncharacterized protein (DUF952 family)